MEPHENSAGPIIAVVLVLLMIILGGFYFWGQRSERAREFEEIQFTENTEATVENIQTLSLSSSLDSIAYDLDKTNVESIDSLLNF